MLTLTQGVAFGLFWRPGQRLKICAGMATVAEGLGLGAPTGAPIVGLTFFNIYEGCGLLGDFWLAHIDFPSMGSEFSIDR